MYFPILSIITFLPVLGAIVVLLVPGDATKKLISFVWTLATFLISLGLWFYWDNSQAGMQFVEHIPWVPEFNLNYIMGVDGISLFLVLLTTLLMPIAVYFSNLYVNENIGGYMALMLLLESAMIGVFLALDMVLFFVFFEFSLIPMYFLIGKWGSGKRVYAAVKFFIYTFVGSAAMLVAILGVYFATGTFNIVELQNTNLASGLQTWAFLAFALAFAVKVPLFPFHTWLPDA
ncbi:MAG: NADH-quinone oxidoreductase subunit M, partial [Caldilineaceae bacterium]|nr:NADH-quinone oxidoreductase subunit M [Caldilineaceae bacterium]